MDHPAFYSGIVWSCLDNVTKSILFTFYINSSSQTENLVVFKSSPGVLCSWWNSYRRRDMSGKVKHTSFNEFI